MSLSRVWVFLLAMLASVLLLSPAWTETQPMNTAVIGQVVTADQTSRELTIREEATQGIRTFKVLNPEVLQSLKEGDRVQVSTADEKTAETVSKA